MTIFSGTLVSKPSLSWNLLLAIASYAVFGLYSELQIMLFSTLAQPLGEMYNGTLYHHYGIVASAAGVSVVSSAMTMAFALGVALSVIFILPRLDSRGRKFVTVYVRFFVGFSAAILQLMASLTSSAELYFLGQIVTGLNFPCIFIATTIYLTECAPDTSRGFVSTSIQMGALLGSLVMYFISEPSVLGNEERWPVIPAISLVLSILLFIFTVLLPESPRWLVSHGSKEEAKASVMFFQKKQEDEAEVVLTECLMETRLTSETKVSILDLLRDDSLRTALLTVAAVEVFQAFSPTQVEYLYTVALTTNLGLTIQQSMQVNFLVHLISAPLRMMGTLLMDRYGRRFVFCLAAGIAYVKILLMVVAQMLVYFGPPSTVTFWMAIINELLSELYGATGVTALPNLLVTELFPPAARVAAAQIIFTVMFISGMPTTIMFPLINAIFPPSFYILLMVAQPVIVAFVLRNLPETAAKSVYDIVHQMDDDVRSRSNTKRHSVVLERQRLLTSGSRASYSALM